MKQLKKTICAFLVFALLLGLCAVPANASRADDAVNYIRNYVIKNGKNGGFGMFTIFDKDVTDTGKYGSCTTGGPAIMCNSGLEDFVVEGGAYWQHINITVGNSEYGNLVRFYLASSGTQEELFLAPQQVYKDSKMKFRAYRGNPELQEDEEAWLTVAFHRAMDYLDSQLRLGGYTLADLGFTNYDKNNPAPCPDYGIQCPGIRFKDMPAGNNWAHQAIEWAIQNDITSGTSDTAFSPSKACTRAQVVTFLWRAAGRPEPETTDNPFEDVNPSSFYYKPVLWAVENGLTKGISETVFKPEGECTRGQVVTFLWRLNGSEKVSAESKFADVAPNAYFADAVNWAVTNGITEGTGNGSFSPNRPCTRAHVVTFLYRAQAK